MASTLASRPSPYSGKRWLKAIGSYPKYISNYWLEFRKGGHIAGVMPLPNGPARFSVTEQFASSVEFTLGPWPKREHSELRSWSIVIAGRSGTRARTSINTLAGDREVSQMAPFAILRELEDFLKDYQENARSDGSIRLANERYAFEVENHCVLLLHAFPENKHYYVEIEDFVFDRSAETSRNSAEWMLRFKGWAEEFREFGRLGYSFERSKSQSGQSWDGDGGLEQQWDSYVAERVETVRTWRQAQTWAAGRASAGMLMQLSTQRAWADEYLAVRNRIPGTGIATWTLGFVLSGGATGWGVDWATKWYRTVAVPAMQLVRVLGAWQQGAEDLRSLRRAPLSLVTQLWSAVRELVKSFTSLAVDLVSFPVDNSFVCALRALVLDADADIAGLAFHRGGAAVVVPAFGLQARTGAGYAADPPPTASAQYTVPAGVFSWSQLSTHLFGSPAFWLALAALNGGQDGYSDSQGAPVYPGKQVQIPYGTLNSGKGDSDALFGVDLAEGKDGDWVAYGDDIQTVKGTANLQQAVTNRMTTQQGAIAPFPQYGMLQEDIGSAVTEAAAAWATLDIRRQILQDTRIADVTDIQVFFENTGWFVSFVFTPVGPQPDKVAVVAPVASFG